MGCRATASATAAIAPRITPATKSGFCSALGGPNVSTSQSGAMSRARAAESGDVAAPREGGRDVRHRRDRVGGIRRGRLGRRGRWARPVPRVRPGRRGERRRDERRGWRDAAGGQAAGSCSSRVGAAAGATTGGSPPLPAGATMTGRSSASRGSCRRRPSARPEPALDGPARRREPLGLGLERQPARRGQAVVAPLPATLDVRLAGRHETRRDGSIQQRVERARRKPDLVIGELRRRRRMIA